MPNAKDGVQRALGRLRPLDRNRSLTVRRLHRRAVGITRGIVDRLVPVPTRRPVGISQVAPRHLASHRDIVAAAAAKAPGHGPVAVIHFLAGLHPHWRGASRLRLQRRLLKVRLGSERALPMGIAMAVIVAGVVSLSGTAVHPVGAAQGNSEQLRIAVGGNDVGAGDGGFADDPTLDTSSNGSLSAYVDDGTFYKPVAVDTVVESGSSLLRQYTVRAGDTLTGIASRFGVSMMTLWWANKLSSKDSLHQGQVLTIPPVNGLVVTVAVGDTLEGLGTTYNVDPQAILDLNNLTDPLLVIGQVLILPGAKGAPIPTPKPVVRRYSTSSGSRSYVYTSGSWAWPVPGGYISQYFHYGHYGVDIADTYGSAIVAARGGTITYAGWNTTGCGYEVRIYIGSNLYVQNCHMSSVGVHAGQVVSKGQFIGRVGMSGNATGPHDHFAVSVGEPFTSGAYFINPLRYY